MDFINLHIQVPNERKCVQLIYLKMLSVIKPDIFCIPGKLRVCKFSKKSMDVNYIYGNLQTSG